MTTQPTAFYTEFQVSPSPKTSAGSLSAMDLDQYGSFANPTRHAACRMRNGPKKGKRSAAAGPAGQSAMAKIELDLDSANPGYFHWGYDESDDALDGNVYHRLPPCGPPAGTRAATCLRAEAENRKEEAYRAQALNSQMAAWTRACQDRLYATEAEIRRHINSERALWQQQWEYQEQWWLALNKHHEAWHGHLQEQEAALTKAKEQWACMVQTTSNKKTKRDPDAASSYSEMCKLNAGSTPGPSTQDGPDLDDEFDINILISDDELDRLFDNSAE